jgi:lipopolysaccharide export system protein LptA
MSRPFFIFNYLLLILIICFSASGVSVSEGAEKKTITITSETLTTDNRDGTAVFEGSVIAKTNDITIYSDKMIVFYSDADNNVKKIHAIGDVKVHSKERAIFSQEASYFNDEEKIIFTGNPKVVEGDNVITGTQITYFMKDDRAVIEGSRVILQNNQEPK